MPRRSRKYCRCFSASGLYGGGSVRGAGRPSSISDCRAAATSASPAIRRNAPVAIQIPERSGFPSAARGAGFAFVGLCALGRASQARGCDRDRHPRGMVFLHVALAYCPPVPAGGPDVSLDPSANVTSRAATRLGSTRARQPCTVTVIPGFSETSFFQPCRTSMFGG